MHIEKIIKSIDDSKIIFIYNGLLSQEMLATVANTAKKELSQYEKNTQKINKIYESLIEMLHNILSYSKQKYKTASGKFESKGICMIVKSDRTEGYGVVCVNTIDPSNEEEIKRKIDTINALDTSRRKEFLKVQLKKTASPNARGAGLGFFEISRRSNYPLRYDFFTLEKERYFAIEAII